MNARAWLWAGYVALWLGVYALTLPALWVVPLVVWFAVVGVVMRLGRTPALRPAERRLFITAALLFPLWEFALKWASLQPDLSGWHVAFNRLEHLLWMTSTVIVLYPLFWRAWRVLLPFVRLVLFVGLASFVGNTVEFYEYLVRVTTSEPPFTRSYRDTIYDMLMNVLGALAAYLLVRHVSRKR